MAWPILVSRFSLALNHEPETISEVFVQATCKDSRANDVRHSEALAVSTTAFPPVPGFAKSQHAGHPAELRGPFQK
jgi:hypothetical protein